MIANQVLFHKINCPSLPFAKYRKPNKPTRKSGGNSKYKHNNKERHNCNTCQITAIVPKETNLSNYYTPSPKTKMKRENPAKLINLFPIIMLMTLCLLSSTLAFFLFHSGCSQSKEPMFHLHSQNDPSNRPFLLNKNPLSPTQTALQPMCLAIPPLPPE